jgi:hypothetical protein
MTLEYLLVFQPLSSNEEYLERGKYTLNLHAENFNYFRVVHNMTFQKKGMD